MKAPYLVDERVRIKHVRPAPLVAAQRLLNRRQQHDPTDITTTEHRHEGVLNDALEQNVVNGDLKAHIQVPGGHRCGGAARQVELQRGLSGPLRNRVGHP